MAQDIWLFVFTLFDVSWVMPKVMLQFLQFWPNKFPCHFSQKDLESNNSSLCSVDNLAREEQISF